MPADVVTATYSRATGETVLGGPYTISATLSPTAVLSNYTITYNTADFTITPKAASVSPNPASKVYGDSDPVLSGSLAGFLSTDGVTATYSRIVGETVAASPYTISATLSPAGVLSNYAITYNTASFTISPRPASVTPNSASKEYGAMDPAFAGTLSGFLPADGVTATYSRNAGETVLGGPYAISGTLSPAGVLGNYDITYNTASFTITAKPASVTPNVAGKVYGDADPALTGTLSGFLAADNVTAAYSRVPGETVAGGPYTISATLSPAGVLSNYNITYNTAAFTITTKAASVTPNPKSKVYGMADPVLDGTLSGFLSADGVTATYSRTAGEDVATSPYTISATLSPAAVLTNYNITYNTANLTITPKPLTITADNKTVLYGTAPVFSVTYGPFAFTDGASALSGSLMFGGSAVGATNVGTYTIVPSGLTSTNYAITFVNGTLEIDPKPLTVSVVSVTRDFGNVTPLSFSVTYSPFAYSETSSVLSGALVFTPAASTFNNTTPASVTTINASGLTATNYSISFVSGTMTILDKTAPVVSMTAISPNPVPLNTPITLTAKITDAVTGGSNIVSACYKVDGGTCIPMTGPFGSQTVNVTGTIPGMSTADVVEVCVYGKDSATNVNAKMDCVLVAIYDPNAGFVTGGGWIDSPPSAYVTNPGLTGKANFGFVSKYKKGANVPDGNTEFQFHAGNLNFKSSVYEWLVVAGARAQFKGTGTINGSGNYGFLLTAIDGQINGGGGSDKFRIKIWDKNNGDAVVYDNQIGNLDTADPTTLLGGGSINIQAK